MDRLMLVVLVPLVAVILGGVAGAQTQEVYKCLQCERSKELMCYNNQTCEAGMKFCYFYKWKEEDPLNYTREWGCAASFNGCEAGCNATEDRRQCDQKKCCNGDIDFGNEEKNLNVTEYKACIYGFAEAAAHGITHAAVSSVIVGLVLIIQLFIS